MKNEFINYNQALKLKELGFNEPCFGYYVIDGEELIVEKWMQHPNKSTWTINAPTFSQAFRFIREKYGIHSSPKKYDETKWWIEWGTWTSPVFETFEEAELAWLDKLIEIVENK